MLISEVIKDVRRPELYILKLLLFLQSGSLVITFPFLPLHMKDLGLTVYQISYVQSISCVFDVFVPLVLGYFTSQVQNVRRFLAGWIIANSLSSLLLIRVQPNSESTFSEYIFARVCLDVSRRCCLNLFESIYLMTVKARQADYGFQKVYGSLGGASFAPLAGFIMHHYSFDSVLIVHTCMQLIFCWIILVSDLQFDRLAIIQEKASRPPSNFAGLLRDYTVSTYLCLTVLLGAVWSFCDTFVFIHLENVGYSKVGLGSSISFSTIVGVLLSWYSSTFLEVYGWESGIILTLVAFSIRLLGYSYIQGDQFTFLLVLESFKSFCNPLAMLTTGFFIKTMINIEDISLFQNLWGSAYWGLGKGFGSLFGGFALGYLGLDIRTTFQLISVTSILGVVFLYFLAAKNRSGLKGKQE